MKPLFGKIIKILTMKKNKQTFFFLLDAHFCPKSLALSGECRQIHVPLFSVKVVFYSLWPCLILFVKKVKLPIYNINTLFQWQWSLWSQYRAAAGTAEG